MRQGGQRIGRRRFRYKHQGNPGAILRAVRGTLGLSVRDVRLALNQQNSPISIRRFRVIEADKTGRRIGTGEWWVLCQCLGISCDILSYGYCEREYLMRVQCAIAAGKFLLPVTDRLKKRLVALVERERHEGGLRLDRDRFFERRVPSRV